MLALKLVITLQIFHLNLAVDQRNKLFKSSEKRADSHLRRNFDPGYSWGNNNNGAGGGGEGGVQPMFRNRRKFLRDRPDSRQLRPTTPPQHTTVSPPNTNTQYPGQNATYFITMSSWVCQEITTRKLIFTMVPTCIISLDVTTPKNRRTVCEWIWVSIIGITPIPVMTCIPLTTCILLDHENSTDVETPSVETECINITSMVTRISTFPNNRTKVITVTTCIYLEPNITCYPTTCIPVDNKTSTEGPPSITFTTAWTTHLTTPSIGSPSGGPVFTPISNLPDLRGEQTLDNKPENSGKRGKGGKRGKRGKRVKRRIIR